jgi:competence protein ComEA
MERLIIAVLELIIGLGILGGGYLLLTQRPTAATVEILPPLPTLTATVSPTPAPLEIYVTGAVVNRQTRLNLPAGSRVEDALAAVGGVLPGANLEVVNLAMVLQDGDMIYVPFVQEEVTGPTVGQNIQTPTPNTPRRINLNTATQAELETLPGIGPAKAQEILAHRITKGRFATVEDLLEVDGIGPSTLDDLRPFIYVE